MLAVLLALVVSTKPCPAPECKGALCSSKADYIAMGTITKVVRHPQPEPVLKDFAEFTLVVAKCPKGTCPKEIKYRVGWCTNARTLPEDTSGLFTFFGKSSSGEAQYLDFIAPGDLYDSAP
jgi:hypothetical protein